MRKIVACMLLSVVIVLGAVEVSAQCQCAGVKRDDGYVSRYADAYAELENSTAVFAGEVSRIEKRTAGSRTEYEITFKVEKAWKGVKEKTIRVRSECSKAVGEKFLVYAKSSGKKPLEIWCCCSRTKKSANAAADLELFAEKNLKLIEIK